MSIIIHNIENNSTIRYSLPLLIGEVRAPLHQSTIEILNDNEDSPLTWPVVNGHFRALVNLHPGHNIVTLRYFDDQMTLSIWYRAAETQYFIRPVYIVCSDSNGTFQGEEDQDCSVKSAVKRISLGVKLIQTFTAEKLREHGFRNCTFMLENDLFQDSPECHIFVSSLKVHDAQQMCASQLWLYFAKELMSSSVFTAKEQCKWLAFLSFTHYSVNGGNIPRSHAQVLQYTKGHAALGGGGLALYGTGTLYSWATSLDQVTECFTDNRKIDRTKLMDDSAYRESYWANYSTGLGATLHELGHTFDLAHTPTGIMARGFDDLYRTFLVDPPVCRKNNAVDYTHCTSPMRCGHPGSSVLGAPSVNGMQQDPLPDIRPNVQVIQIEASFQKITGPTKLTFVQNDYDGTQVKKTVSSYIDGTELVSLMISRTDGEHILQEQLKHAASGKSRITLSVSMKPIPHEHSGAIHSINNNLNSTTPILSCAAAPQFREPCCRDGGAHWYRASAVLLNYHKWFQSKPCSQTSPLPTITRSTVEAGCGIRLIELRNQLEGVVFHHWEFLQDPAPVTFTFRSEQVVHLAVDVIRLELLVQDNAGNIIKKRINLNDLFGV